MKFEPSPQQQAVFDWVDNGTGSAFVEAVAGSGKTTTLVEACSRMDGFISFAAFNKSIATEIDAKVGHLPRTRASTFHSFGFGAWRRFAGSPRVDAREKGKAMAALTPELYQRAVSKMVSIAKQSVVFELWDPDDDLDTWLGIIDHFDIMLEVVASATPEDVHRMNLIDFAVSALYWARDCGSKLIDFDDMLWLPLIEDVPFFQVDWLLVDEAQDTNPARRLIARRMLKDDGRAIFVGDRHQAIYGFTGADSNAVDLIQAEFDTIELPLTITYRCPKAVVELAQRWVGHIEAHESAPEGTVIACAPGEFERHYISGATTETDDVVAKLVQETWPRLRSGDAILCRNTRPLVSLAFRLLREGIACHVEGRDIGKQITKLATRWKVASCAALTTNLEAYRQREYDKLMLRDARYAIEALNDRVDTLLVIMEGCDTVADLVAKIDSLFSDSNGDACGVTLSTVHKAKGREWDRVFILGFEEYMPSRYARQAWQKEQEANIQYVAVTRAKQTLILLPSLDTPNESSRLTRETGGRRRDGRRS